MRQSTAVSKVLPAFPLPVATFVAATSTKPGAHNIELEYDQAPDDRKKQNIFKIVLVITYA